MLKIKKLIDISILTCPVCDKVRRYRSSKAETATVCSGCGFTEPTASIENTALVSEIVRRYSLRLGVSHCLISHKNSSEQVSIPDAFRASSLLPILTSMTTNQIMSANFHDTTDFEKKLLSGNIKKSNGSICGLRTIINPEPIAVMQSSLPHMAALKKSLELSEKFTKKMGVIDFDVLRHLEMHSVYAISDDIRGKLEKTITTSLDMGI